MSPRPMKDPDSKNRVKNLTLVRGLYTEMHIFHIPKRGRVQNKGKEEIERTEIK